MVENENFVRVIPRSGYEVTALTPRDFEEIFELSRIVWPTMMALAAKRNTTGFLKPTLRREEAETGNWIEDERSWLQAAADESAFTNELCVSPSSLPGSSTHTCLVASRVLLMEMLLLYHYRMLSRPGHPSKEGIGVWPVQPLLDPLAYGHFLDL